MFHKPLVDERVNSAIEEGLESQRAARARKTKARGQGFIGRLLAKLRSSRRKIMEDGATMSPPLSELPQETEVIA